MTLQEIISDIHGLDAELEKLEQRYGILSDDLYHLYKAGEIEQSRDFLEWIGYYEAKLERVARYRGLMYDYLRQLRQTEGLDPLRLDPQPVGAS